MAKDFDKLVQDLRDKDWEVRQDAAESLGELGDARAVEPLIAVLRDKLSIVRIVVAEALGKLGDARAVEPLIAALRDEHSIVRMVAAEALGKLGDARAVEPLIAALEDYGWLVRRAAAEALNRLTQKIMASMHRAGETPTILVIDDEPGPVEIVRVNLEWEGYRVITAYDGREGWEAIRAKRPDLVILDVMMPKMSGLQLLERIKADPRLRDVPVIMLTVRADDVDVIEALEKGATDYLTKPFDPLKLVNHVHALLHRFDASAIAEVGSRPVHSDETIVLRKEMERLRLQRLELFRRIEALGKQELPSEVGTIPIGKLGQLVSGIVHDLRGGLGVIRNTAGFALGDVDRDNSLATDLRKIIQSAEFCDVITRNLMALGGGEVFEPAEVNIEEVVREVFFMLERKLADVTLIVDADPDTPTIMADEGQMKQVFMNLIKNAGEAMPDGGTLTVRTRREEEMLRVEISDTGCGILPENLDRVFDLYFTTKEKASGIGLRVVRDIVERHGGTVKVESEVGYGTTFTIRLPIE